MLDQQINTKKQGDCGLAVAISWFALNGYTVSIPLTDSQEYDLIVDKEVPQRVQVKTSTYKTKYGNYAISLTVKGGNRSGKGKIKKFDKSKVDLVFIFTLHDEKYLIPVKDLEVETQIILCEKYKKYLV